MSEEVIANQEGTLSSETVAAASEKKKFAHFILFFTGQQFLILGSSIVSFVLIWWITEITQSELMLGLASLVSLGPFLFIAPLFLLNIYFLYI
ncbi:MAG: hypothetical protein ACTSSH_11335 [Candidatus Heimdallarchaeota archaeon]